MSRIFSLFRHLPQLLRRMPTLLRTIRPLRRSQLRAQVQHVLFGLPTPKRLEGPAPTLAIDRALEEFLPVAAHVSASAAASNSGALEIELLSMRMMLGEEPDWAFDGHGPLFAYHLHQHEYLRVANLSPALRLSIVLNWIEQHPAGVGWDPHPISLRLFCWGKMLLTPGGLALDDASRERVLRSFADQAVTLAAGLETRLQANHLLSNMISVVWAGMLIECGESAAWRGLADDLVRELDAQVHPDGGHEERSPMYHGLILESLLDLLNLCRACPGRAPAGLVEALEATTERMLDALDVVTHPDARIALFADSGFDVAAEPAALRAYARRLVPTLRQEEGKSAPGGTGSTILPQTGYVRLAEEGVVLIASIAGPAPPHQPGHAHCDALAFELSLGGRRLVTDTGLFEYRTGERRDRARATASHSTLQIDGAEQAEIWSAHRVGGRPQVELLAWDGECVAEASCVGWSTSDVTHQRRFEVSAGAAQIIDVVEGHPCEIRFAIPIDPAWRVQIDASGLRAEGFEGEAASPTLIIELAFGMEWSLERGPYYPSFGREVERGMLVGLARGPGRFDTRFRLA